MQRFCAVLLLTALSLAAPLAAHGDRAFAAIRKPEQLTVGLSDDFLGQVSPDEQTLFFVSDRNTLHELYAQDMESGRAVQVFDEGADITWVRVSPEGHHLLYISFRDEAAGQLCVRDLHTTVHGHGNVEISAQSGRRCLDDGSRAVQAQWISENEIALVSRSSLQGDLQLSRVSIAGRMSSRPMLDRNLTSPSVSPDGRWLVYVPVKRFINGVGPGFAARAAQHLEAVRLDESGTPGPPQPLALELPGQAGQPSFSPDGKMLYFAQFFNDTNRDGAIDASDHGVLFRVPFESEREDAAARAAAAFPEQLTDSAWNCQYPSPARKHLIATCAHGGDLDVYSLPPDGVVPHEWDSPRLRLEIELSAKRNDLLLMYRHLLQREKDPVQRHQDLARLIMLHVELEELDAADFYARLLDREKGDPAIAGLGKMMIMHVAHLHGMAQRERGRAGTFREKSRERLATLTDESKAAEDAAATGGEVPSAAAAAMQKLVRSEISDSLGDKEAARRELEAAALTDVAVPAVLEAYYDYADELYRQLDDPMALYAVARGLSVHPRLLPEERLRYARAAVRALVRGRPFEEAQALIARELGTAAPDSELYFALSLALPLQQIRDANPKAAVLEALVALYKQQTRPERRHAVMVDAGERATEHDANSVLETLVQLYVDDVPKGTRERGRAERLYQRVMEGRAYRELDAGQRNEARDDFAKVERATGSLESCVEYIDLRLKEGATPEAIAAEYEQPGAGHSDPVLHFVRAYLLALQLPHIQDPLQHAATIEKASAQLRAARHVLYGEPAARVLYGVIRFEEFLRTGDKAAPQKADVHYLVALNLAQKNPRYLALILEHLGLLQAQAGNYRIAMGYLEDREKLPFPEPAMRLVHLLMKAKTLLHLDRDADAAKAADEALAVCDSAPSLADYRVLVLDRAALYNLSAGQFARALSLYDAVLPLIETQSGSGGERNRMVTRLARAAAALGAKEPARALTDLSVVDAKLGKSEPPLHEVLKWPHTPGPEALRAYRIIAAGLRARAHRASGQLDEAARALTVQATLLQQRQQQTQVDEALRPLALAEGQLAEVLQLRGDAAGAGQWLRKALDHAETFVHRTRGAVGTDELALLWLAAELHLRTEGRLGLDFFNKMKSAHQLMVKDGTGPLRGYGRLFELYLPIVAP